MVFRYKVRGSYKVGGSLFSQVAYYPAPISTKLRDFRPLCLKFLSNVKYLLPLAHPALMPVHFLAYLCLVGFLDSKVGMAAYLEGAFLRRFLRCA